MYIFILILTLFLANPVYATYSPRLYQNSPLIMPNEHETQYFQSSTISQSYGYGMWFSASDGQRVKIALARSANGIDWYATEILNVSNSLHSHDPSMHFENDIYTLYFGASNGGSISIWKNSSSNENGFTPSQAELVLSAQGGWEGDSLSSPHIFKSSNEYYLLYAGNGNGKWQIGLATSSDGRAWRRCAENPILPEGSGPAFVTFKGMSHIFFNSPRGLEYVSASDFKGCQTQWSPNQLISNELGNPNPIVLGNDIWLYGDHSQGIGLMTQEEVVISYPVILIPGMFASWNKEAILHNQQVAPESWQLNPVVTEYQTIQSVFSQLGYTENKNFFTFTYDWRQPVTTSSQQLDTYLQQHIWDNNKYQPVQIIGHSLGGVISHVYTTDNLAKRPIKKSLSVAAPLNGTLQSYKPLAAGEIERDNTLLWLAENIILQLNAGLFKSKREVVQNKLPILNDLIPTYPFLFDQNGVQITSSIVNTSLYSRPIQSDNSTLIRMAGVNHTTKAYYELASRTSTDMLLNTYPDGHPINTFTQDGDGTVPGISANVYSMYSSKALHGETIFREDYVREILKFFNLNENAFSIPQGKATQIFPAILLFLQSPATMKVMSPDGSIYENDSYIHLVNANNGIYTISVIGSEIGNYTIHIWTIGKDKDHWTTFKGKSQVGSVDTYLLNFDENTGGNIQIKQNPVCEKYPNIAAFPHWCKSKVFSNICTVLRENTTILLRQQTVCKDRLGEK